MTSTILREYLKKSSRACSTPAASETRTLSLYAAPEESWHLGGVAETLAYLCYCFRRPRSGSRASSAYHVAHVLAVSADVQVVGIHADSVIAAMHSDIGAPHGPRQAPGLRPPRRAPRSPRSRSRTVLGRAAPPGRRRRPSRRRPRSSPARRPRATAFRLPRTPRQNGMGALRHWPVARVGSVARRGPRRSPIRRPIRRDGARLSRP